VVARHLGPKGRSPVPGALCFWSCPHPPDPDPSAVVWTLPSSPITFNMLAGVHHSLRDSVLLRRAHERGPSCPAWIRPAGLLLVASLTLVLGACQSGAIEHPVGARGGSPMPSLSQYLLTVEDLPGWSVEPPPGSGDARVSSASTGCLDVATLRHLSTARVNASFQAIGSSTEALNETIASYPPKRGFSIWEAGTQALDNCHHLTVSDGPVKLTAAVNELDLAYYGGIGDEDSGFSISFSYMGVEISEDVAFVLKGNNIVSVGLSGMGPPTSAGESSALYTLAMKAVSKVPEYLSGRVSNA
jgi:hypothetical protein